MIIEIAQLTIRPGSERQFEAVFPIAVRVLGGSNGYLAHELRRGGKRVFPASITKLVGGARVGDANRDRGMRCPACSRPARSQSFSAEGCAGGG